ncbi:hypothetical protein RsS62_53450 [Rhizobium dioscoreae]|uniref:pYEATS domain-containing protein n=1 Tax=Rhizobium dioscoreae TaxID=2653122 RepID=UPI001260B455|nr:pYEATS domain-containing protein [Rhizobium dioscoreae]GES46093.1 hypothetical protein RsS62_53450 [Rhizobium dioscoreae]
MTTSLHFEAPVDLSVGTVRIVGDGQTIADWVATPDNRIMQADNLKPGLYSAEIHPAGVSPQSVVFEVREGQANTVILPSFSALSSTGSNTSFFDTNSLQTMAEIPVFISDQGPKSIDFPPDQSAQLSGITPEQILESQRSHVTVSTEKRRITIGLSEERAGRETFDMFEGQTRMELFPGRLEIELPTDIQRDYWTGRRVRLSAAIEQVRIERCLLPLYRGGTKITIAAPAFSPSDLELSIFPVDPKLRALVRALDAGTSEEVVAVRDELLAKEGREAMLGLQSDPWGAILVGLLGIRFPGIIGPFDEEWGTELTDHIGWAFDAHVIRASLTLAGSAPSRVAQDRAIENAVSFLAAAQVAGSPYYRYSNQLFGEMAAGIASYIKANRKRLSDALSNRFDKLYSRWHRDLPLQRGSGPTFTWLARDLDALKERKVLVPKRNPSGKLRARDTTVIFEGQVSAGQIAIISGGANASTSAGSGGIALSALAMHSERAPSDILSEMPAFGRPPGPDVDPNNGRFGGQLTSNGFSLSATFEPTKSKDWVTIDLTVEAERSAKIAVGDFAWFVLHPTFSPSALRVAFRGNRARLRIQAYGGFTVGVWLPRSNTELECNLATIAGAPKIIRLR